MMPATVDPQQAERERIKKENERKMNAYRDQKKKAEDRVAELNARFANWYYVVSEDVYKKLRLVRSDIVKEADDGQGRRLWHRRLPQAGRRRAESQAVKLSSKFQVPSFKLIRV